MAPQADTLSPVPDLHTHLQRNSSVHPRLSFSSSHKSPIAVLTAAVNSVRGTPIQKSQQPQPSPPVPSAAKPQPASNPSAVRPLEAVSSSRSLSQTSDPRSIRIANLAGMAATVFRPREDLHTVRYIAQVDLDDWMIRRAKVGPRQHVYVVLEGVNLKILKNKSAEARQRFNVRATPVDVDIPRRELRIIVRETGRDKILRYVIATDEAALRWKEALENAVCSDIKEYYSFGKVLGTGAYGEVVKAVHNRSKEARAIKIIKRGNNTKSREHLDSEIQVMKSISHPNIVQTYQIFDLKRTIYIVMEYVEGGDLFDFVAQHDLLSESQASQIIRSIFTAVEYLHSHAIVHRDLKPENILCANNSWPLQIKVTDFGFANFFDPISDSDASMRTPVGTVYFMAPEIIANKGHGQAVDSWACGVILYTILTGRLPFPGKNTTEYLDNVLENKLLFPGVLWKGISPEAMSLVKGLLNSDPKKRLTSLGALHHTWIAGDVASSNNIRRDRSNLHSRRRRLFKARKAVIAVAMANKFKATIPQVVDKMGDSTKKVADSIEKGVKKTADNIEEGFKEIACGVKKVGDGIGEGTKKVATDIGEGTKKVAGGIAKESKKVAEGLGNGVKKTVDGVETSARKVGEGMKKTADGIETGLKKTADGIETGFKKTADGIETGLKKTADGIETGIKKTAGGIEAGLKKTADGFETGLRKTADGLEKGVKKTADGLEKGVKKTADGLEKGVKKTADGLEKGVKKTADGLEKGVKMTADGIEKSVKKTADGVKKTADGIERGVKKTAEGFEKGVKKTADNVKKTAGNLDKGVKRTSEGVRRSVGRVAPNGSRGTDTERSQGFPESNTGSTMNSHRHDSHRNSNAAVTRGMRVPFRRRGTESTLTTPESSQHPRQDEVPNPVDPADSTSEEQPLQPLEQPLSRNSSTEFLSATEDHSENEEGWGRTTSIGVDLNADSSLSDSSSSGERRQNVICGGQLEDIDQIRFDDENRAVQTSSGKTPALCIPMSNSVISTSSAVNCRPKLAPLTGLTMGLSDDSLVGGIGREFGFGPTHPSSEQEDLLRETAALLLATRPLMELDPECRENGLLQ